MSTSEALATAIDAIEGGYEFMLAYAAQGRKTDQGASEGPRDKLEAMASALDVLPELARKIAAGQLGDSEAFFDQVERDAAVSAGALRIVLARKDISSQLIDSLNASIHLRAVLTDIFLIDEALNAT